MKILLNIGCSAFLIVKEQPLQCLVTVQHQSHFRQILRSAGTRQMF